MKDVIVKSFRIMFPFLTVLFLWRLNINFWNPGGILALIPIFYCTFIRPVSWFMPFGLLFCFLIDYNLDTLCWWTAIYCLCYAINGFQVIVNFRDQDYNAIKLFMFFLGIGLLISEIVHINWIVLLQTLWVFCWSVFLYLPITNLIRTVRYDR